MGLQDNRILSIPRHVGFVFKSFGLGRAFFFLCVWFFFPAVTGCQHSLHQLEIRTKKTKLKPQQKKKNQKTKTDLKPDSQTAQRHTVTCWRVTGRAPKTKSAGIVGQLAHFIPGDTHMERYTARSTALQHTVRSWQHGGTLPTSYTFIPLCKDTSEDRTSVSQFWFNQSIDF